MKRSQPQPPHTGGTFRRRLQPLYTEKHKVSCSGFLPNTSPMQHSSSHYNAFCSITWQTCMYLRTWQQNVTPIMQPFTVQPQLPSASKTPYKYVQTNNHLLQNREQEPIRRWNDRNRNRHTQEVPFVAGCSHFTRKNTRFRAPASSPTQAPCNIHPAITMRFAASRGKPACIYAHGNKTWHQSCSHSLCNHSFHQLPKHPINTYRRTTTRCRTESRNRFDDETIAAATARGTFRRRLQPLYMGKHKVSCSGFLHNTSPMQHACSQHKSLQCVSQPKIPKHHMYVTAMCRNMRNTSKQLLHCGLLLGLAEPSPHPPHTRSTFNRRLQPIYTEKHNVLRSSFPPNTTSPMQQSCSHYNAFCSNTYTSMRPLHYDFHPLVAASIVKSQTTICDKKFRTTLHECIVMWCKVSQPHTTLHDVLLCDVKSHTTLHECIVMWCKVSPPFMMSCYVM